MNEDRNREREGVLSEADAVGKAGALRVFDLHCDTLDRLALHGDPSAPGGFAEHDAQVASSRMESLSDNDAHISLARTEPFSWCQCLAVFVPDTIHGDEAWSLFERVHAYFARELVRHGDRLAQVRGVADIESAFRAGRMAGMLTVEGASFLEDDGAAEERLDALVEAGVRMVTLTWNGRNAIGSGHDTGEGLSPFGGSSVRELERRGIVVDVSHLNDQGFRDVLDTAERPFVASHSNARAVCGHPRNLADWQLHEIANLRGIVGLNFCRDFLSASSVDPTHDDVLRQVDHILEITGEGVVALGSDYDGCTVPTWLDPCDRMTDLHALIVREFGPVIAGKLCFDNARSFFERAEAR